MKKTVKAGRPAKGSKTAKPSFPWDKKGKAKGMACGGATKKKG